MVTPRKGSAPEPLALFGLPVRPTGTVERKAIATIREWRKNGVSIDPLAERQMRSLANAIDRAECRADTAGVTRANIALAQVQLMFGLREAPDRDIMAELSEQMRLAGGGATIRYAGQA